MTAAYLVPTAVVLLYSVGAVVGAGPLSLALARTRGAGVAGRRLALSIGIAVFVSGVAAMVAGLHMLHVSLYALGY